MQDFGRLHTRLQVMINDNLARSMILEGQFVILLKLNCIHEACHLRISTNIGHFLGDFDQILRTILASLLFLCKLITL